MTYTFYVCQNWYSDSSSVMLKNLPADVGDTGDTHSIPGSVRDPGEGNGNRLQYSCLEYPMDSGVWKAIDHGAAKSQTRLRTQHTCKETEGYTLTLWSYTFKIL